MKKILLLATSLLILNATPAKACSCLPSTPEQNLERAETVFSGRVIDVKDLSLSSEQPSSKPEIANAASGFQVTFEVSNVWKGEAEQQLVVMTSDSSASCGYWFQEGEEYLVYASEQEAKLETGLCSGTKQLSEAQADLTMLGEGETPTSENSNASEQLQQNLQLWTSQNIRHYRYTLRVSCFCLPKVTEPVVVEVRNGRVASIKSASNGRPVDRRLFEQYNSVSKLFGIIQDAIAQNADGMAVTYHPTLGYPTQINIDYSAQMADEERFLTIENLQVIR